jgi:hypothetical protein
MIHYEAKDFPVDGLVATGEDVKVHVPAGTAWRAYELYGDHGGSITVAGEGDGSAWRSGDGDGSAWRSGTGKGIAVRTGDGNGEIEEKQNE